MVAGIGAINVISGIRNKRISSGAGWCRWVRGHCRWKISFRQCACRVGASF